MKETMYSIMQWHAETFPDATLDGQLAKYQEEQQEWVASDEKDLFELADMFIVACGIARFDMHEGAWAIKDVYEWLVDCVNPASQHDFFRYVDMKMNTNRQRTWHKQNGLYKHNPDEAK